jgi:hypothetical protein
MLSAGHRYGNCLNNDAIASILELTSPLYYSGDAIRIPSAEWLRPGQCISMRAEPHVDDPRTEWPAVVRHVYHHRSGCVFRLVPLAVGTQWARSASLPRENPSSYPCLELLSSHRCRYSCNTAQHECSHFRVITTGTLCTS